MSKMEIFLNYLFILFAITFTLANNQNIEETENTTENVSVAPAGVKTRKIYKLGRDPKELKAEVDPLSTEVPWKKVNLSDVSNDTLNTDGFINVACYTELKAAPEKLYNKAFRFDVQKVFEKTNKHCMLRFPVGMYLQYRFKFSDPNTYAFWALGNSPNFTVGTTRLISSTEMYDQPFNWWKGVIHVPCRFATLVFRPYVAGEIFEFKFLPFPPKIVDKCSKLEDKYYQSMKQS